MDALEFFAHHVKNAKTPAELRKALEALGPLPRCFKPAAAEGQVNVIPGPGAYDVEDTERAIENAKRCYVHVRQKALDLWQANPALPPPPAIERDPHLAMQTITQWCTDAERHKGEIDLRDYLPATEVQAILGCSYKVFTTWLKDHPEIRRFKPRKSRLMVHVPDALASRAQKDKRESEAIDDQSPEEMSDRYAKALE
jgi:hypothetical protein